MSGVATPDNFAGSSPDVGLSRSALPRRESPNAGVKHEIIVHRCDASPFVRRDGRQCGRMREGYEKATVAVLARQHGVIARTQLDEPAMLARIARRVRSGTWQAPAEGVYVDHNGPLTGPQRRWSALLACGPAAAWAGPTVLELHRLTGWESDRVHIAVPHGMHGADMPGVEVARMRALDDYLHPSRTPRQLRLPLAVLQTAGAAKTEADTHALLCAAVQQGRVAAHQLRADLEFLPRISGRALIRETLLDIEGGAHSVNEIAFRRLVRRAGLPAPSLQVHVATERRRTFVDGGWPDLGVWFEIDGELHREASTWADDLDRANELAIDQGGVRLRWPGFVVRRQQERVIDQIRRAFAAAAIAAAPGALQVGLS